MNTPQPAGVASTSDAPIYAGLVEERGDVLAEVRRTAEQALRQADQALDFSLISADAA
ncbi:hypothetical protein ACRWOO_16480 [Streptomyces sp. NEAU-PBA10]|uniref:Uncharacterized protein n=2 Tax=Streptomyces TaxID=1883 RepID=A0ABP7E1P2_9ACTN|nr:MULTISPECIES: hypothetical protein [Streptomyces]MBZ3908562.1 hypothetical protein [Streptomyces griseiscabiei]MDX2916057.1 hypothetical protein [Streptomyces griseiscabiei]